MGARKNRKQDDKKEDIIVTRYFHMNKQEVTLQSRDEYNLSLAVFLAKEPKANVMFIHGMEEYKERYDKFASYLQERGYNVFTSDLRGHGKNAPKLSHIADKDGDKLIIQDQQEITKYIEENYKGLPLYIFAHSMGTIITRVLLQSDSEKYSKVALSGYVNPNPASGIGLGLTNFIKAFKKPAGHSKMINNLAVGQFSKAIKDAKTPLDWLSYNEENVQNYINDPLCGVEFTLGSFATLFGLMKDMGNAKKYQNVNSNMPILLIAGDADPCTGYEKGRKASLDNLHEAGFKDVSVITLEHMRHEILNEVENLIVYDDILKFFDK